MEQHKKEEEETNEERMVGGGKGKSVIRGFIGIR